MNDMWEEDTCGICLLQGDELYEDELEDIRRQVGYVRKDSVDLSYWE